MAEGGAGAGPVPSMPAGPFPGSGDSARTSPGPLAVVLLRWPAR